MAARDGLYYAKLSAKTSRRLSDSFLLAQHPAQSLCARDARSPPLLHFVANLPLASGENRTFPNRPSSRKG